MIATATAHGASGSAVGVSVQLPTATVSGITRGYVSEGVTLHSGSLGVNATGTLLQAVAIAQGTGIGILASITGLAANAVVSAIVEAFIGAQASLGAVTTPHIDLGSGAATLTASSHMVATASANSAGGGALSVSVMLPSAHVTGITRAYAREGVDLTAGSLAANAGTALAPVFYESSATSTVLGISASRSPVSA